MLSSLHGRIALIILVYILVLNVCSSRDIVVKKSYAQHLSFVDTLSTENAANSTNTLAIDNKAHRIEASITFSCILLLEFPVVHLASVY